MALAAECILYKVYVPTFACYLMRIKDIRTFCTYCATPTPGAHHQILRQNMDSRSTFERISFLAVFRIRIRVRRIRKFSGLPDPDPLVRGADPDLNSYLDSSIIIQK